VGHVTRIWGEKRVTESFGGKAEEKRQVGGPRCRRKSNSKMKFWMSGKEMMDWIALVQV